MMTQAEEVWFVEDLLPSEAAETAPTKGTFERREPAGGDAVEVRVNKPLSLVLSERPEGASFIAADSALVVVRLGIQFAVPLRLHEKGHKIVWARCSASMIGYGAASPRVIDLFPRDLYDDATREIQIDLSPKLRLGSVEASAGNIRGSVGVGHVQPVMVGYAGADERAPYWEITPKSSDLIGTRDFWLLVEAPSGTSHLEVSVKAEVEVRHQLGRIPLGPRETNFANRPRYRTALDRHGC
jgi:hypothetical protein